jgi:cbb3-type cytochrome oxidase subunit 3
MKVYQKILVMLLFFAVIWWAFAQIRRWQGW